MPLVTVVIPTFRRPHLVERAIASVQRQTFSDVEILIVDDGSKDDTEGVVTAIGDARIRYVCHERNRGLPAARNTGIRYAAGEYIAFLDDDDEWKGDKLEKQIALMERYDAVFTGALVNGRYPKLHNKREVTKRDLQRGNNFPPSTLLVRAALIRAVGFDENLRLGEDWDAYIRLVQVGRIGYVNEPLLLLNDGNHARMTNATRNVPVKELQKHMAVLLKHKEFFGHYRFRRHTAAVILSYLKNRTGKFRQLQCAVRECGLGPVLSVLFGKTLKAAERARIDMWGRFSGRLATLRTRS